MFSPVFDKRILLPNKMLLPECWRRIDFFANYETSKFPQIDERSFVNPIIFIVLLENERESDWQFSAMLYNMSEIMRKSWNLSGFKVLHFGKCERRIFYFSTARWAKCNTAQFYNFISLVFVCWGCVITGRGHVWTELVMKEEGCAHWECARLLARSRKDEQDSKVIWGKA